MGIYESRAPCGCISETYTMFDPFVTVVKIKCLTHGGNAVAIAAWQARNWQGPDNPYADPSNPYPQSSTNMN